MATAVMVLSSLHDGSGSVGVPLPGDMIDPLAAIRGMPRLRLAHLPTPMEPMPRLAAALGLTSLWVKRDDCTGLGGGGNKVRKLEFDLAAAQAEGADCVVCGG